MIDLKKYEITIYEAELKDNMYSIDYEKNYEKLNYYYCDDSQKTIEDLKEFIYETNGYSTCPCKLILCKAEYRKDLGRMNIYDINDFTNETLLSKANKNNNFFLIEVKNKYCNCKYYSKKNYFYMSKMQIINAFENKINAKNKEITDLSEKLKKINERIVNQSNDNLKLKMNEKNNKIFGLNEQIFSKNKDISSLEYRIQNLKKENSKYKNDLSNLNKNKENQIKELMKNMDKLKVQLDEKKEIIKKFEIEKNELKKDYDNLATQKQILEKNYLNKEENEKNLNKKLTDAESKISELTFAINSDIGTIKQFNDLGLLKNITINNNLIQIDPNNNQIIGNNNQENEVVEKNLVDFYDIIVNIKSVKDIAKGWEIKMTQRGVENFEKYKKEELIKIGVIGNSNKGKSFLLSRISKIKLPSGTSIKTEGLSVKYPELKEFKERRIVLLDSAGLETPVLKENDESVINKNIDNKGEDNDEEAEKKNEGEEEKNANNIDDDRKNRYEKGKDDKSNSLIFKEKSREKIITELFLQNYIINNSDILILVVGILTYSEQKLLNRIKIEIQKSKTNKPLFIIHNLKTFLKIKQVEEYIENTLRKSATFELKKGHKITTENKSVNGIYFFEKNSNPKIYHLIFANEGSEAGNYYNNYTLAFIKNNFQNVTDLTPYNVIETIKDNFIELSKDIIERTKGNKEFQRDDIIDDEQILKNKVIKLKTPQEITLKRCLIDELGFSNLKGNGFEPKFNYYKKDDKIIIRVEAPGNSSIESDIDYSGEYTIIRLNGEKKFDKEPKNSNDNIHTSREFGHFNLDIPLKKEDYNLKNKQPMIHEKKGIMMLEYECEQKINKIIYRPKEGEEI